MNVVAGMDVDVLVMDDVWFEWPLLNVYMYMFTLPLLPFGQPPVVLCHNLLNIAFWQSNMLLCLSSLTLLIKAQHSLKVTLSKTLAMMVYIHNPLHTA